MNHIPIKPLLAAIKAAEDFGSRYHLSVGVVDTNWNMVDQAQRVSDGEPMPELVFSFPAQWKDPSERAKAASEAKRPTITVRVWHACNHAHMVTLYEKTNTLVVRERVGVP